MNSTEISSEEGRLEVFQGEKLLSSIPMWTTFGELAILYNCTRTASVKGCRQKSDRPLEAELLAQANRGDIKIWRGTHFRVVSLLKNLPEDKLTKIIDCLEVEYYDKGDYIIREGEEGSTFFILAKGKVKVTQSTEGHDQPQLIKTLQKGEYFGEKALIRLYRTFKDNKYVYMLLEACLGGELWSILRDRGSFDEPTSKFCVACVTEAFDYLHRLGIIYRDLKPENLILDAEGYLKLVDFGFAKKIGSGQKTWTFCGTPEYVAPEVILNKGHDFSVDFWSLGILVYELLTGKWLNGFNWEGLKARSLPSPLRRELSGPIDHSYFDKYPPEKGIPPDELSGWDKDF
ncbi:PREDICTED: cGMP-dependent protein kinase 2 [Propithecus coquereli]|uniref:cGMP-dependent protein kinase 2 n=1 Tax=Propithecus coquereli TaxID=379532 RepID=UPI00063F31E6|nr:PREDICTED: cGMP-dependent protein kinase 2 [Propithecus coquereli]